MQCLIDVCGWFRPPLARNALLQITFPTLLLCYISNVTSTSFICCTSGTPVLLMEIWGPPEKYTFLNTVGIVTCEL